MLCLALGCIDLVADTGPGKSRLGDADTDTDAEADPDVYAYNAGAVGADPDSADSGWRPSSTAPRG
ncbi:MAG: hypothetical protein FJ102_12205 [Deltaproteobacteria bacterium]|nr:hypothetical protein [Deltaproteobacteria bacterium]